MDGFAFFNIQKMCIQRGPVIVELEPRINTTEFGSYEQRRSEIEWNRKQNNFFVYPCFNWLINFPTCRFLLFPKI